MKNKIKLFIIIELQIVVILLIFTLFKLYSIEKKVYNTNSYIYKAIIDKSLEDLKTITDEDVVIGDTDATLTMIMYTKPDCIHCQDFMEKTFAELNIEFIETGDMKLVFRYLSWFDSDNFKTVLNDYASMKRCDSMDCILETLMKKTSTKQVYSKNDSLIIMEKSKMARQSGIHNTPTFIIGTRKLVGNIDIDRLRAIIKEQLMLCE